LSETYLTKDSPFSQQFFIKNTTKMVELWRNLPEILKKGPVKFNITEFFKERVVHSLAQNTLSGELQKTVEIVSSLPEFKTAKKLLDLGGGHGLYAIAFSILNKNLQAFVFDLPGVVEQTKEYLKKYGVERVHVIPGNFFVDDFGKDYDIIFSSYNPGGKKLELIPKIYSSLKDGGLYINKQYFPDKLEKDKTILLDLEWCLWVFDKEEKGDRIYSFKNDATMDEYLEALENIGFKVLKILDITFADKTSNKIIICKKQ
ncbi:methyltransferase, partial [Candidatus Bathyarchaeota archaeon]